MQQVIFTVGLPGSGKTGKYTKWASEALFRRVLCRDDIRMLLSESENLADIKGSKEFEQRVTVYQETLLQEHLANDLDVCVADTNLNPKTLNRLKELVKSINPDVDIVIDDSFLDVPLPELIKRNSKRGSDYVPEDALLTMWEKYVKGRHFILQDSTKPACVVFDVDGTLAIMGDRSFYEWDKVGRDAVNEPVRAMLAAYTFAGDYAIDYPNTSAIIVSGRDGVCKKATEEWLNTNCIDFDHLFMRSEGDTRTDWIVKEEILRNNILPNYHVSMWVDDRYQVVLRMRELGIPVAQVDFGRF